MSIRHVQFPCGRHGLEVFEGARASQGSPCYRYFYNGFDYLDIAKNEKPKPIEVTRDYYGRIVGLVVLKDNVDVYDLIRKASQDCG
jgi:hypothetical protein